MDEELILSEGISLQGLDNVKITFPSTDGIVVTKDNIVNNKTDSILEIEELYIVGIGEIRYEICMDYPPGEQYGPVPGFLSEHHWPKMQ